MIQIDQQVPKQQKWPKITRTLKEARKKIFVVMSYSYYQNSQLNQIQRIQAASLYMKATKKSYNLLQKC